MRRGVNEGQDMHDDDTVVLVNASSEWEASFIAEALTERNINAQPSAH